MIETTRLTLTDILPLTCSRTGTCCHGKLVLLNPWELVCLAKELKILPSEFCDLYCEYGGIKLRFDGKVGWKGQRACSQYIENLGCSVHSGRPLACRLYPLGRQIQSEEVHYIYQGKKFPCLDGCPEVSSLPQLTVGEYLEGQNTKLYEKAQDAYLEVMQNMADIAFMLLLDTGLSESGDRETLKMWRTLGNELPEKLVDRIGKEWIDILILPQIIDPVQDPVVFAAKHNELLHLRAQEEFAELQTNREFHEASVLMMAVALQLARSLGANTEILAEHWIETAKNHGAVE